MNSLNTVATKRNGLIQGLNQNGQPQDFQIDSSSRLITNPLASLGTPRVQATSATAANIVLTSTCRRVSMLATTGTWYSLTGTATTTSHYIAAGERLDFSVPASTTISVLQETSAGSIRISELE